MQVSLESIEKNRVSLKIEVGPEKVDEALEKAYRKVVKKIAIPGFRKGRVPRTILEARFGKEVLYEDALEFLVPVAYQEAVKETDIKPIDQPNVDIVQMEAGQPLIFKADVEVVPEVKLGEYKGVAAVIPEVKVGDDEVEIQLQKLQDRHAKLADAGEGPVQDGDFVVIDYTAAINGVPEPRLVGNDETVEVGSLKFLADFESYLLDMKVGEEKEFEMMLPSLFKYEDLAEKTACFKVVVKQIKRKELSPIDDEFARDISEFDTLEEFKKHLKNKMEEIGKINAKRIFTERIVEKVVAASEVEVPEVLVKSQIEEDMEKLARQLTIERLSLDQYLKIVSKDYQSMRSDMEAGARNKVKERLVLGAIVKEEGIKVEPEEIEEEISLLAAQFGQDNDKIKAYLEEKGQMNAVEEDILLQKARQFLADNGVALPDEAEDATAQTEAPSDAEEVAAENKEDCAVQEEG